MSEYGLIQTSAPGEEPLLLLEAKQHLRVDDYADDALISSLISTAREYVETATNRQLVQAGFLMTLDCFPVARAPWDARGVMRMSPIVLPRSPVLSVDTITYIASSGTSTIWDPSEYKVDTSRSQAQIVPAYGEVYPTTYTEINAVTIGFTAGYGNPADVPAALKSAMKLIIGHLYENREQSVVGTIISELPMGVTNLLALHKVPVC